MSEAGWSSSVQETVTPCRVCDGMTPCLPTDGEGWGTSLSTHPIYLVLHSRPQSPLYSSSLSSAPVPNQLHPPISQHSNPLQSSNAIHLYLCPHIPHPPLTPITRTFTQNPCSSLHFHSYRFPNTLTRIRGLSKASTFTFILSPLQTSFTQTPHPYLHSYTLFHRIHLHPHF